MDIYSLLAGREVDTSQWREALRELDLMDWYRNLPDALYFALLDSAEVPQSNALHQRKRERVVLAHNKNQASVDVYRTFVHQAALRTSGDARPRIAVVTASSRDPFEVADFYRSVFENLDAEVIWLPLDGVYQRARWLERQGVAGCERLAELGAQAQRFYREGIYPARTQMQRSYCQQPEKMRDALASVQGIFFNGGDQSLTLAALTTPDGKDSAELTLIKAQLAAGKLIVGGTSAGTAVQAGGVAFARPLPMLTNGHAEQAMARGVFAISPPSQRCPKGELCTTGVYADDLTLRASGGSGLFQLGLLDTHFSERDRELRLARFAQAAGQRLGFGVDEATALLVAHDEITQTYRLGVVGQGGVFVLDRHQHGFTEVDDGAQHQVTLAASSHYLTDGWQAQYALTDGEWSFVAKGQPVTQHAPLQALEAGSWRDAIRAGCGSPSGFHFTLFDARVTQYPSDKTAYYVDDGQGHCAYTDLPFDVVYRQVYKK